MMSLNLETLEDQAISIPMPQWLIQTARQFAGNESSEDDAQRVLYNTLAVGSVKIHLQILGYSLDLSNRQCWDPVARHLLDVADLEIKEKGILECRPIHPNEITCKIPPETLSDRIGYVVVEIDLENQEARLLGFSPSVEGEELSLTQLQPLDELPQFLYEATPVVYHLTQWFKKQFEAGVMALEEQLSAQKASALRLGTTRNTQEKKETRLIPISLTSQEPSLKLTSQDSDLILIVNIREGSWPKASSSKEQEASTENSSDDKLGIAITITSRHESDFLPSGLSMTLLKEDGERLGNLLARHDNRELTFKFNGEQGERFGIEIAYQGQALTKHFCI